MRAWVKRSVHSVTNVAMLSEECGDFLSSEESTTSRKIENRHSSPLCREKRSKNVAVPSSALPARCDSMRPERLPVPIIALV